MKRLFFFGMILVALSCGRGKTEAGAIAVTVPTIKYFVDALTTGDPGAFSLLPAGADPHTYEPSPADVNRLAKAKMLVLTGHMGFEEKLVNAAKQSNPGIAIINIAEGISMIRDEHHHDELEHHDGDKEDHDHHAEKKDHDEHEHHAEKEEDHHDHGGVDPHIWVSLNESRIIAATIAAALSRSFPERSGEFRTNLDTLLKTIEEKERRFAAAVPAGTKFIIYHPSMGYLARQFKLEQMVIELEGKEPGAGEILAMAKKARSSSAAAIFIQQEYPRRAMEIIAKEASITPVTVDFLAEDWQGMMDSIIGALSKK